MSTREPSVFIRLSATFCCHDSDMNDSAIVTSPKLVSSKMSPCRDSVYCLHQYSPDHIGRFSHPCRFNEVCRNEESEPHLVHERHPIPTCYLIILFSIDIKQNVEINHQIIEQNIFMVNNYL